MESARPAMFAQAAPLMQITERFNRWRFSAEDLAFEWRHRLDLNRPLAHDELTNPGHASLAHATSYQGVWCRNVRHLVQQARRCNGRLQRFVDIGSGKGKACFFAAGQAPFEQIIGLEFSPVLDAVARSNQQRFGDPRVAFVCGDAADYRLPDGPNLVFMFNPFDGVILERFLLNNLAHFRQHGSVLAYANDIHRSVARQLGFDTVFRDPARCISLHRCA